MSRLTKLNIMCVFSVVLPIVMKKIIKGKNLFLLPIILSGSYGFAQPYYMHVSENIKINSPLFVNGHIKASQSIIIVNTDKIYLTGNWINDASEDCLNNDEGTVIFNSDNSSQDIKGDYKTNFHNLTSDNTNSGIILQQNIGVANELTMEAGYLDLQNSEIDLGSAGVISGESADEKIFVSTPTGHTGTIKRTAYISETESFTNPGNIGISLKPTTDLGNVTIIRGHHVQQGTGSHEDNYSIARYFDILPSNNDIETEMRFYFWDAELEPEGSTHHLKSSLIAYRYLEETEPYYWTPLTDVLDAGTNNFVDFTTPGFSKFTLGSDDYPLPVDLLYFNAEWTDNNYNKVSLNWETASEMNSDFYKIFRSEDNLQNWEYIKTVDAAGFSNENILYTEIDESPPINTILYYRLKQVDFDGSYEYSNIDVVFPPDNNIEIISIYPNPGDEEISIEIISNIESNANITIYDKAGKTVILKSMALSKGRIVIPINISKLSSGIYVLQIITEDGRNKTQREFIKR